MQGIAVLRIAALGIATLGKALIADSCTRDCCTRDSYTRDSCISITAPRIALIDPPTLGIAALEIAVQRALHYGWLHQG